MPTDTKATSLIKRSARVVYRAVPLGVEQKMRLKGWMFRNFRPAFERTRAYQAWLTYEQLHGREVETGNREANVTTLLSARFPYLRPLNVFLVTRAERRLTIVTDSINLGSLFGGVGTAVALGAAIARHLGIALRIVTRTEKPNQSNIPAILDAFGIDWPGNIEFAFAGVTDPFHQIDVGPEEMFLTTSWWTTWSVRAAVGATPITYLLQEDERMFYPMGEEHLRCSEVLADPDIRFVVNSRLLFDHLGTSGAENVNRHGVYFEPAFPRETYYPEPGRSGAKRNFFFYARPNHERNLFYRGLEALNGALEAGILHPDEWDFHFVGGRMPEFHLAHGVRPRVVHNLPWQEYASLVRRIDLGLSLMYTPHPSYPPLDLAASGAVVVTNRFGNKSSLAAYSPNIITTDVSERAIIDGLRQAVDLVHTPERRTANFEQSGLNRDWNKAFETILTERPR